MTLLDNHLEQISLSATAIADLAFPAPKIFTNALLHSHDITTLIRDTEAHESALFTLASPSAPKPDVSRRSTIHDNKISSKNRGDFIGPPRHNSAVATLLGSKLGEEVTKEGLGAGRERGEVNVEILLEGAEKLCAVYPVPDASERIASLRTRFEKLSSSIVRYESRVSKQTVELARMNKSRDDDAHEAREIQEGRENGHFYEEADALTQAPSRGPSVTPEELRREEEEIRELEKKKRGLEDLINGMEIDLGGL